MYNGENNMVTRRKCSLTKLFFSVTLLISFQQLSFSDTNDPLDNIIQATQAKKEFAANHQKNDVAGGYALNDRDQLEKVIQRISYNSVGKPSSTEGSIVLSIDNVSERNQFSWNNYLNSSLSSRAAMVMNATQKHVLYEKNSHLRVPLASISKLMAAMVFLDAKQDMDTVLTITKEDVDHLKHSSSRLSVGTALTRQDLLHIGLMSSENRAIHALARSYPGGVIAFVRAMNIKAKQLGMYDTVFYEPTGLDPRNQSTAADIIAMAQAADQYPLIRKYSTDRGIEIFGRGGKALRYVNTNSLVRQGLWNVGLQKTGYIREAGRCMVVKSKLGRDDVYLVFLGAPSSYSRVSDAEYIKQAFGNYY